jgi:hypothetical protein
MTLVDAVIAGPVLAAVVRDIRVRVHGPRVTAVQQRTRRGGMRVDPAAIPGARVGVVGPTRAGASQTTSSKLVHGGQVAGR